LYAKTGNPTELIGPRRSLLSLVIVDTHATQHPLGQRYDSV
jgi:hypothetical protein